jgi:tRNA 2-thiouridine synthesizing protein A
LPPEPAAIDARGLRCPLPVLKTEALLARLPPGAELIVLATDPMAKVDIPLYCRRNGHDCTLASQGDVLHFTIRKLG